MSISIDRPPGLALKLDTPKGRGVFASDDIPAGTIVEISPVLVLGLEENEKHIRHTSLYHYTYNWPVSVGGENHTVQAVVFGLGSMFNHSQLHQNIGWKRDIENLVIRYSTLRDIQMGEELCISYGSQLTFEDSEQAQALVEETSNASSPPDQVDVFR